MLDEIDLLSNFLSMTKKLRGAPRVKIELRQ